MKKILFFWLLLFSVIVKAQSQTNGAIITFSNTGNATPADATTYFIGYPMLSGFGASTSVKMSMSWNGSISQSHFIWRSIGVTGTNENISIYVRITHSGVDTDYLIATVGNTSDPKNFDNSSMNATFVTGDLLCIVIVTPTWATNPTNTMFGGYVYIKPTP